ncbi:hypothetical protein ACH4ZU_10925 [Streptomyces sp. NPDC020472]|uniref:hypothetical protein n=1 Tax=Streptomyces sp. NPDC020472 TaxID=3365075 RepID=UPI00378BE11B
MAEADSDSGTRSWGNWVTTFATLAAPTTFIGALLLYFGFAYTDALYAYFGVDAATLGFSTQEYALRSAGALYVPAGAALTVALAGVLVYYAARTLGDRGAPPPPWGRPVAYAVSACGLVMFALGVLGGFAVWGAGAMDTPLLIGGGLVLVVFGRALSFKLGGADYPVARERLALALVAALVGLSCFWAVHAYAKQHGTDDARYLARRLWLRPAVTVDTAERLYFPPRQVRETPLPVAGAPQRFRYRYEGLRLLAEVNGRMFLIPEDWARTGGGVLVVPTDGAVRVAFRSD